MSYEIVLRVIEIVIQLTMVAIARKTPSVWKSEIHGQT